MWDYDIETSVRVRACMRVSRCVCVCAACVCVHVRACASSSASGCVCYTCAAWEEAQGRESELLHLKLVSCSSLTSEMTESPDGCRQLQRTQRARTGSATRAGSGPAWHFTPPRVCVPIRQSPQGVTAWRTRYKAGCAKVSGESGDRCRPDGRPDRRLQAVVGTFPVSERGLGSMPRACRAGWDVGFSYFVVSLFIFQREERRSVASCTDLCPGYVH